MCIQDVDFFMDNRKRGQPLKSRAIIVFADDAVPSKSYMKRA
jgi:hypothetical protein